MDELERRMERVLAAAREGMTPDAADTARTRRALLAATAGLAVGVGTGSAAAAAGASGGGTAALGASKATGIFAALSGFSTGAKVVTAVAMSGAIGTAGILATQSLPDSTPSDSRRSTAPMSAPAARPVPAPIVAAPAIIPEGALEPPVAAIDSPALSPTIAPRAIAVTEPEPEPDPLSAELLLIESARQALRNNNPGQALTALSEHRARFQHGVMAQERTALRALALCSLGDPKGREEAQRFLEQTPGSPLAGHLRAGCK